MPLNLAALDHALNTLPLRYKGPGGAVGVVHQGKVLASRVWGYADMSRRLSMTAATRLPICSISKQFTCALLLDQVADPAALDAQVRDFLPAYTDPLPRVKDLADNQSGLRDYWALTVLHGAHPEQEFRREDALPLLALQKTGQFAPGTAYSYSNGNFRILAELIQRATGRDFAEALRDRILRHAGMETAVQASDTRVPLDGVVGYEGNDEVGFLPAQNGIWWMGDAGISASLTDMLAWEAHIDATRNDPASLYARLSAPATWGDGSPAFYANGLRQDVIGGHRLTGHGGALRGFRANRQHVADERLSVVVLFNHEANAHGAATWLLETALGITTPPPLPPQGWNGLWLDQANGLIARTTQDATGLSLRYGTTSARLTMAADGSATANGLTLRRTDGTLHMERLTENLTVTAQPLAPVDWADGGQIAGRYCSDELQAEMVIEAQDGVAFAGFSGLLGQGPMERVYPQAQDVWIMPTRRSMDAAPPGDWTIQIRRDAAGGVAGLVLGCWLARNIAWRKRA